VTLHHDDLAHLATAQQGGRRPGRAALAALACAACCALPLLIGAGVVTVAAVALAENVPLTGAGLLLAAAAGMWWLHRRRRAAKAVAGDACGSGCGTDC